MQDAKIAETSNISEEDLFALYQDAYRQFEELNSRLVGIGGFVVGIIGIFINFI